MITLAKRCTCILALLLWEAVAISARFDAAQLFHSLGERNGLQTAGLSVWAIHFLIGFAAIYATFGYLRYRPALELVAVRAQAAPLRFGILMGHAVMFLAFVLCGRKVERIGSASVWLIPWLLTGAGTLGSAILTILPWRVWAALLKSTELLGFYALFGAFVSAAAVAQSWRLWPLFSGYTFSLVMLLLKPILPSLVVKPAVFLIGSDKFQVIVASSCSGLEGAALLTVFLALWLLLFSREIRLPQALLVIPIGVGILFLLNAVRIAALVLIGHAGWPDVAARGFHSQAGWIAFNFVAFGIVVAARHIPWITRPEGATVAATQERSDPNAVAVYLLPFLAILAAGMLSRAVSGNFEWFYGLRFFAAVVPLWHLRAKYADIFSEPDWRASVAGVAMFVFWVALDRGLRSMDYSSRMPEPLVGSVIGLRVSWVTLRVLTAVIAVPVAEELAFRGYLLRRFVSENFERVSPRQARFFALAASSLIFGVLHGSRWVAGTGAGIIYAAIYRSRANLSSAVLAHATTNLLLAAYVLASGEWAFW